MVKKSPCQAPGRAAAGQAAPGRLRASLRAALRWPPMTIPGEAHGQVLRRGRRRAASAPRTRGLDVKVASPPDGANDVSAYLDADHDKGGLFRTTPNPTARATLLHTR